MDHQAKLSARQPGPDGILRVPEAERRLDELALSVFSGANGAALLEYLRTITVNAVCGPEISANALFHREGMRFLVAVIEQRIARGKAPHVQQPSPQPSRTSRTGTIPRRDPAIDADPF